MYLELLINILLMFNQIFALDAFARPSLQSQCNPLNVATFTFDLLGSKTIEKDVFESLSIIIKRYDIVLLIGLSDTDDSLRNVTSTLLLNINSSLPQNEGYKQIISIRLGTAPLEQYSFFYKPYKVSLLDFYQFPTYKGSFVRSPFSAFFSANCPDCTSFWLQAIHTNPHNAFNEIQDLYTTTFRSSYLSFGTTDGIILGNLNADCSYLSDDEYKKLDFNTDSSFTFGLQKDIDSTSVYRNQSCAFDNLILYKTIKPKILDIRVYNFSVFLGKDLLQSLAISDHYPIEMKVNACPTLMRSKSRHSKQDMLL